MSYGWYYEDQGDMRCHVCPDLETALEEAVADAAPNDKVHLIRVGEMQNLNIRDLIFGDDVSDMLEDAETAPDKATPILLLDNIFYTVSDRCGETVEDGGAFLLCSKGDGIAAIEEILKTTEEHKQVDALLVWAEQNIEPDPTSYCNGEYPFPIRYMGGRWFLGMSKYDNTPDAFITYETELTSDTGKVGWTYWIFPRLGIRVNIEQSTGTTETLREAKEMIEEAFNDTWEVGGFWE